MTTCSPTILSKVEVMTKVKPVNYAHFKKLTHLTSAKCLK